MPGISHVETLSKNLHCTNGEENCFTINVRE